MSSCELLNEVQVNIDNSVFISSMSSCTHYVPNRWCQLQLLASVCSNTCFECRFLVFFVALSCWSYSPDCDCRQDVGQEHGRSGHRRLPRIVLFQVGRLKLEKAILSQAKLIATDLVEL